MAITRWDPFRELNTLQNQMNRLFQDNFGGAVARQGDEFLTTGAFIPPVDVYEDEHNIYVRLEAPGMSGCSRSAFSWRGIGCAGNRRAP